MNPPADRAALLARIVELETALQPFAHAGQPFAHAGRHFANRSPAAIVLSIATADISVADLVAAQDAITNAGGLESTQARAG
jgi:hypothetical protein